MGMPDGMLQSERPVATAPRRKGDRAAAERESRIYEEVVRAIVERRLPPGAKLPELQLADIFGTSRTRMRRVLGRLARDGMVSQVLNRGSFVARPTLADAREVFEARRAIEDSIVRRVAARRAGGDLQRLRAHVARERTAAARRDAVAMMRLSGEFHLVLADIAGNRILAGFLRELVARSSLVVALYEHLPAPDCSHVEHAAVVEAIAGSDGEGAAALMARHLGDIEARLRPGGEDGHRLDLRRVFAAGAARR